MDSLISFHPQGRLGKPAEVAIAVAFLAIDAASYLKEMYGLSVFTEQEKVKILSDVIGFNTVNDNEMEVCQYFSKLFEKHGIESEIVKINEKRANLVAEIGEGRPIIGISGHMDVVSPGDLDKWTYDPFILTEKDGKLYGRGAADMKSGLTAMALALIEIKEQNLLTKGTLRFLATTGEEIEQTGSQSLYEKGYMDDVDALIIGEPSENMIVYSHKGSMDIKVTSKGNSAHSSAPFMGFNAITPLLGFVRDIEESYQQILKDTKSSSFDFSELFQSSNVQLPKGVEPEQLGQLVLSNTVISGGSQVNSIPEAAEAQFNVRTIPEFDNEKVKQLFNDTLSRYNQNDAKLAIDVFLDLQPVTTNKNNSLVQLTSDLAQKYFDANIPLTPSFGVTDASNLLRGKDENFPFVMFGPGKGTQAHTTNEYVDRNTYVHFIEFYKKLICTYAENN